MLIRFALVAALSLLSLVAARAQQERLPSARLIPASRLVLPAAVDTNVPMTWQLVDGTWALFAVASWGGTPALLTGAALDRLQGPGAVSVLSHPGHGIWISSFVVDEDDTWYGYYHHEVPAYACGRPDRFIPSIGSLRSSDRGQTWEHLGIILEAPADRLACASTNRYLVGGVGDVSVMRDADGTDLFLFLTQYSNVAAEQGVAVARLAWADRDAPRGRLSVWRSGAWIPQSADGPADEAEVRWESPVGTPLLPASRPWHDGNPAADAFWGPSVHWNEYLGQYVMLLNRARDEMFNNEGIYVSYARTLDDPAAWSAPRKLRDGGGWYPQVAGLEPLSGTDKHAGQRARFFLTGRSEQYIEFQR